MRRSLALARRATDLDPTHGPAYAMRSLAHAVLGSYVLEPPAAAMERARRYGVRALALDPTLGDAHTALGLVYLGFDWNWAGAERALARAVVLRPDDATAWSWLGFWHLSRGNLGRALRETRRAARIDPESLIIRTQIGWVLYFLRRYSEAQYHLEALLADEPGFWRAHLNLALCHLARRECDSALGALETASALNDLPVLKLLKAQAHAGQGNERHARRMLEEAMRSDRYLSAYYAAQAYGAMGELRLAGQWLERAQKAREWFLIFLRVDPALDNLRHLRAYRRVEHAMAF